MFHFQNNKEPEEFEVNFYSGYKGDETPKSILIGKREYIIDEILCRKRIFNLKSGKLLELFKCRIGVKVFIIEREESGGWKVSLIKK